MQSLPVYKIENFEFYNKSFYARQLKEHIQKHGFIQHPHKHDFYLTVLFTQGTGTHEIDFTTYPVAKGSAFFLVPGQVHRWTLTDDTDGYIFFHTKEFYDITYANKRINDFWFFSAAQQTPLIQLAETNLQQAEGLFKRIVQTYQTLDSKHKYDMLAALCNLLYLDMEELQTFDINTTVNHSLLYQHKINELRKLIDEHYIRLKYPKEYADLMNISTKHLNRICNETLGKSTGALITERLVLEAKRILTYSDKPIKQIAEQLGFDDPAYFIRFFKKHTGQTPVGFKGGFR
jgi:AraC family transcriptional regulator, transcriptional activator of pobA